MFLTNLVWFWPALQVDFTIVAMYCRTAPLPRDLYCQLRVYSVLWGEDHVTGGVTIAVYLSPRSEPALVIFSSVCVEICKPRPRSEQTCYATSRPQQFHSTRSSPYEWRRRENSERESVTATQLSCATGSIVTYPSCTNTSSNVSCSDILHQVCSLKNSRICKL